jgi:hypothetical protein
MESLGHLGHYDFVYGAFYGIDLDEHTDKMSAPIEKKKFFVSPVKG